MSTQRDHAGPDDLDPLDRMLLGLPCPQWCTRDGAPDRHLYRFPDPLESDEYDDTPRYRRTHSRVLASALPAHLRLGLTLEQSETTDAPDLPGTLEPVTAWLEARDQGADLTATTARQLAALLLDAADHLDTITGSQG